MRDNQNFFSTPTLLSLQQVEYSVYSFKKQHTFREALDDTYFLNSVSNESFSLGHEMKVVGIDMEDEQYEIILKVKEGRRVGAVPLCDVEVTLKENENYWPVREYAMWFANQ